MATSPRSNDIPSLLMESPNNPMLKMCHKRLISKHRDFFLFKVKISFALDSLLLRLLDNLFGFLVITQSRFHHYFPKAS